MLFYFDYFFAGICAAGGTGVVRPPLFMALRAFIQRRRRYRFPIGFATARAAL